MDLFQKKNFLETFLQKILFIAFMNKFNKIFFFFFLITLENF
jgi:hypothetical protein